MNNISLMGRLTADPELKQTQSDISVCQFCIAVSRPHTSDKTDFINCVAWRNTAEFISKYFCKGKMIAVNGVLTSRNYEDREGKRRTAHDVLVDYVNFCGDKSNAPANENPDEFQQIDESIDEQLPFR